MSDVTDILSAMGSSQGETGREAVLQTMGAWAERLGALSPTTATGDDGEDFLVPITGALEGSTLTASDEDDLFSIDDGNNLVATAIEAGTYAVTVTESNAQAPNSPHDTVITVTIS